MRYLKIRQGSARRSDGSGYATPLLVHKDRKFGKVISEKAVPRKRPLLITGAHDSGKTRWLQRLYGKSKEIWGAKHPGKAVYLCATRPITSWADTEHVGVWWDNRPDEYKLVRSGEFENKPWRNLRNWQRCEVIADYLLNTKSVLFIDDAHKLAGRKLQIARECVLSASMYVITVSQPNRMAPNLRTVVLRRDPEQIKLDSETAYDVTNVLMWFAILFSAGVGATELALVLGGMKLLGTGRRAARQD